MRIKKENLIFLLIGLFLVIQSFSFLVESDVWWDSAVFIGMGKYIFSWGNSGLWEASRPLIWPSILGFIWKLGLDVIVFGKFLMILFSTGCIYITYLIGKKIFNDDVGLISAFFLGVFPTFFLFSTVLHTEIISLFFFLLGFLFFLDEKYKTSGLLFGICFMTRFFSVLALLPFFIALLLWKKYNQFFWLGLFFSIPVIPYLIFNQILYSDYLYPFNLQSFLTRNTGSVFNQPYYFYVLGLIKENVFLLLSFYGCYLLLKQKKKNLFLLGLILLFAFIPYNLSAHKEMRLVIMAIPILCMASAYCAFYLTKQLKEKQGIVLACLVLVVSIQSFPQLRFNDYDDHLDIFYDFVHGIGEVSGEVWVSNPAYIIYSDQKAEPIYYPKVDLERLIDIKYRLEGVSVILLDTCDLKCQPKDDFCDLMIVEFVNELRSDFELVNSDSFYDCDRYIFRK